MPLTIKHQRLLGLFFLLPLFTYGVGTALLESLLASSTSDSNTLLLGGLLVSTNSIIVIALGYLISSWLSPFSPKLATLYRYTRFLEALLLFIGLAAWCYILLSPTLPAPTRTLCLMIQWYCYQSAMLLLGLGSLAFCWGLYQASSSFSVVWSWWASLGYSLLALGSLLELLGWPYGLLCALPGGLFEACFGLFLCLKSFWQSPIVAPKS
ncbi:MAG: DUF4386 family protein [Aureispira sp.]